MLDPLMDPAMSAPILSTHTSNALSEDELVEVFEQTQAVLFESNAKYEIAFAAHKKEILPLDLKAHQLNEEMVNFVRDNHMADIKDAMNQMAKSERSTALRQLRKSILTSKEDWVEIELKDAIEKVKKEQVRGQILNERVRADGRSLTEVRPISISTNVLPAAHSSCKSEERRVGKECRL